MLLMTVLRAYMNQRVTLERRTRDENGDPVGDEYSGISYDEPETIMALYEPASGTVRTGTGPTDQITTRVVSVSEIRLGDKIEGSVVKGVDPVIDFDGTITEYEAFL